MKILAVRFLNLNSLKGKFEIEFNQAPIKDSGLFLITGNTGAGKSTILDAITLALFGAVSRFEDMLVNKKDNQIMTHGANESYAEVEFESAGEVYLSKWSLKKKKDNSFANSKRELAKIGGDRQTNQILATKKKEVNTLVEELLGGLDFKRFRRSVLLAQGEFAEFLKGTKDRSTILERITNSDRYSKISIASFERHKEAQMALNKLEEQRVQVQLLSNDEKLLVQEKLTLDESLLKDQEKEKSIQKTQLQIISKLEELELEQQKLEEQLEVDKLAQINAQTAFDTLLKHQQALEFKPALDDLEQSQIKLKKAIVEIEELEKTTSLLAVEITKLKEVLENQSNQLSTAKEDFAAFEKVFEKVVQLDTKLEGNQKIAVSLQKELEELTAKAEAINEKTLSALNKKKIISKEQEITTEWLEKNKHFASLVGSDSLFELKRQYNDLLKQQKELLEMSSQQKTTSTKIEKEIEVETTLKEQRIKNDEIRKKELANYQKYCLQYTLDSTQEHQLIINKIQEKQKVEVGFLELLKKIEQHQKQDQKIVQELAAVDEDIEAKKIKLEESNQLFLVQKELLEAAQKNREYHELVYNNFKDKNDFSAFRGKLKEEEECPLCFSKEQPFRKMEVDISYALEKAALDFKNSKDKVLEIEKKYRDIIGTQGILSVTIQDLQKNQERVVKDLAISKKLFDEILKETKIDLTLFIKEEKLLSNKIEEIILLVEGYNNLEKIINNLYLKIEAAQKDNENIEVQLQQNTLRLTDFREQLQAYLTKIEEKTLALTTNQKAIQKELQGYQLDMEIPKAIELLGKYKEDYAEQLESKKDQIWKLEKIETYVQTNTELVEEAKTNEKIKKEDLDKQKNTIEELTKQRFDCFGEKSVQVAKQQKVENLENLNSSLDKNKKDIQEVENKQASNLGVLSEKIKQQETFKKFLEVQEPALLESIKKIGLENLEQLKASILDKKTADQIAQQQQELKQRIHTVSERLKASILQYQKVKEGLNIPLEDKVALLEEAKKLEEQINELLQSIGSTKEKLRHQGEQEKHYQALYEEIKDHKKELARWSILKDLIGSSDGKKFRVFAQSITLKKLVNLANQHLQYFINGRYYLEKRYEGYEETNIDNLLEIDIVDTYQANNKRPLNTLSGGESFLASLALALGLSDLAGGGTAIDSLFIDEGFGTLDSDTLQMAIRALQTLQSRGKIIGVISHIEQMKQCIPTQIHVVKKGGGFSDLTILEN